jgi:hypothetical protein
MIFIIHMSAIGVSEVGQMDIHIAEPLVPEPSPFAVGTATEKLEKYKLPGIDQIPSEMIQAGKSLCSEIHDLMK